MPFIPLRRKQNNGAAKPKKAPRRQTPSEPRPTEQASMHPYNTYSLSTVEEISSEAVNDLEAEQASSKEAHAKSGTSSLPRLASRFWLKGSKRTSSLSLSSTQKSHKPQPSQDNSPTRGVSTFGFRSSTSSSSRKSSDSFPHQNSIKHSKSSTSIKRSGNGTTYQNPASSTSRLSLFSNRDKKSKVPTPRITTTPPVLTTATPNDPPAPRRFGSMLKLNKRRSASVSVLHEHNHSHASFFSFGRGQPSPETPRSKSELASHNDDYLPKSGPSSIRGMKKSVSQRSVAEMKRFSDYTPEGKRQWDENDNPHYRKTSEDNGWPKFSLQYSPSSHTTSLLSDVPPLRVSSDATTPSTSSSSPVRVAFETNHVDSTDAALGLSTIVSSEQETILKHQSRVERKSSLSVFWPISNLYSDTSADTSQATPERIPSRTVNEEALNSETSLPTVQGSTSATSSFRAPLQRFRRKTVSRLFNIDNVDSLEVEGSIPRLTSMDTNPPTPKSTASSRPASPVSQTSITLPPHPLVRSHSNLVIVSPEDTDIVNDSSRSASVRRRSRTLSSLDPRINHGNPFASRSRSGIFSSRRDSEFLTLPPPARSVVTPSSPSPCLTPTPMDIDSISLPLRETDDTPETYLKKVNELKLGSYMVGMLAKHDDVFSRAVLRKQVEYFNFEDYPLDMALRKFLMSARLPKETQQIDRMLEAFAFRYHQCNPTIYSSAENAYFIVFSLVILQTDVFNKNNKFKMQKSDYYKNTQSAEISKDILGVSKRTIFFLLIPLTE